MVQVHDGGGGGRPDLPAQAGPNEKKLHELYDFQSGIVSYTASQWQTTSSEVTDLAASVRRVVRELRSAPDGGEAWSGGAAEAAYSALGNLAANLDTHAEDLAKIESGLTKAGDAVVDARSAYVSTVRTISLDVDEQAYMRTPFMQPSSPVMADLPATLDQGAYDAAVAQAKAEREAQAAAVLATFDGSMTDATKKLPVDPAQDSVNSGGSGGGGGGGGGYPSGGSRSSGTYVGPTGGSGTLHTTGWDPPTTTVSQPPRDPQPPQTIGCNLGNPETDPTGNPTPVTPTPVTTTGPVLDGPTTGTTGPLGGGVSPTSGSTGVPGGPGGGGIGGGGAAAGMGGMIAGGGAAALMGRAGGSGALGGRPGIVPGGGSTTAARGGSTGGAGRGGTGATGRSSVLPGGGQGAAGRAGGGGRGGGGAAGRTGRYGVPQLGERGGKGVVGAGGAGGAGGRRGKRDGDGQDVDRLTNEDQETWFEGAEDATPPVWE